MLDDGFATTEQHDGAESMSADSTQHASKVGGTATSWGHGIGIQNNLNKLKNLLLKKERMECGRVQGTFISKGKEMERVGSSAAVVGVRVIMDGKPNTSQQCCAIVNEADITERSFNWLIAHVK